MDNTITQRKFGVEIEFTGISQEAAAAAINAAGIPAEVQGYNHLTCRVWKVVIDVSCGLEVVSPILQGEDGINQIRKVCDALTDAGALINRDCRYHVHLDVSDFGLLQFKNLLKLWVKFEDVFDTFQPPSRRSNDNTYCRSNLGRFGAIDTPEAQAASCRLAFEAIDRARSVEDLRNLFISRYHKLNVQAYFRHRTIEIRHHSGTINADKAANWVLLMMELYETAKKAKTVRARPENNEAGITRHKWFFQRTMPKGLRRFFTKRARQLQRAAA